MKCGFTLFSTKMKEKNKSVKIRITTNEVISVLKIENENLGIDFSLTVHRSFEIQCYLPNTICITITTIIT